MGLHVSEALNVTHRAEKLPSPPSPFSTSKTTLQVKVVNKTISHMTAFETESGRVYSAID